MKRNRKRKPQTAITPVADWEQVEADLQGLRKLSEMQHTLIRNLEKAVRQMRRQQSVHEGNLRTS